MKSVVIYSGGLDSTVLLYHLKANGHDLSALSVDYGQRHRRELDCAAKICKLAGVPNRIADLSSIRDLLSGSSLTSPQIEVAEGHYTEESMKKYRRAQPKHDPALFTAGHALSLGANQIAYAAHSGDHAIYPDCRNEFADAVRSHETLRLATHRINPSFYRLNQSRNRRHWQPVKRTF